MPTPPPVTDTLARFVANTDYSTISDKTLANAKMHILDTLGAALAGVSTDTAPIAFDYCKRVGNSEEASIWGTRLKSSAPRSASNIAPYGPEMKFPSSKTLIPSKQPFMLRSSYDFWISQFHMT